MKKRILLFTSSIALLAGMVMSNGSGPISNFNGNRTGSQGSTANCSTGGCHSANNSGTLVTITLGDSVTGLPISGGWKYDRTYKVTVGGTSAGMTKYGFQLSSVYFDGSNEVQAGTFTIISGTALDKTSGNLKIVEHTAPLNMSSNTYAYTVYWKAPPAGAIDSVRFYATVNCVNNDGTINGDRPNTLRQAYHRYDPTSVVELNADIKINAYPNPMTDKLNISLENADKGEYSISVFDMQGKVVATQTANVNKSFSTSVNVSSWAAGMYHVQLKKGDAQRTIAVVKQ